MGASNSNDPSSHPSSLVQVPDSHAHVLHTHAFLQQHVVLVINIACKKVAHVVSNVYVPVVDGAIPIILSFVLFIRSMNPL